MARRKSESNIPPELLDKLLAGRDPKSVFSREGLLDDLKKALAERILNAELDHHLDYPDEEAAGNHKNGTSRKTILTDTGSVELAIPCDRHGRFEQALIEKYQRRFPGFNEKLSSLYARGMTTREIQGHLKELYGLEISPELVSAVTEAVLEEVTQWQNRPLEPVYAVVFFDALRVKIRDEGTVRNESVYLAIGHRPSGHKEVLGLWIEQTEGAKFWMRVMTELKNLGLEDILLAVVDGLKGFPEASTAVFPQAQVKTCIVHLLRHSIQFASWKERKALAKALAPIYRAATVEEAQEELTAFEAGPWGTKYPMVAQSWRRNWEQVIPFFAFPREIRKILYTTNAIESLHSQVQKAVRVRGHLPSDEAATKLIWLILQKVEKKWIRLPAEWHAAKAHFSIMFQDRFVLGSQ